jgi:hypothetical protein
MTPDEREELLAAYALGTLSAPDAADVESLVSTNAAAAADLARYHELVDLIALSVPMRRADPRLRERVLDAARRESLARRVRRPRLSRLLPVAALAAVLALTFVWGMSLRATVSDLRSESAALTALVEANAKRLDTLDGSQNVQESRALGVQLATALQDQQVIAAVQTDPNVRSTDFEPTASGHGAGGRYLWSESADAAVIVAHDLPQIPFGNVYRVWIEDSLSRLTPVMTFVPDGIGNAQVILRSPVIAEATRIFIVATSNDDSDTVEGPVVLQATVRRG